MSRHSVTATYKPCAAETFQVTVTAASGYPDAIDEARAQAVRGIHDMMTDALEQYGRPNAELTGEAEA